MTDDTKLSADKGAAFLRQNPEIFQPVPSPHLTLPTKRGG